MLDHSEFNDEFQCDLDGDLKRDHYSTAFPFIIEMTDYKSCMENIDDVFGVFDDNKDGYVSRCEDAQFQYSLGETKEFALKFSAPYTKESFRKICGKRFAY